MSTTRKYIIAATAATSLALVIGLAQQANRLGYKAGWQDAQIAVQKYLATHHEAVVFVNPNNQAAAIVQDGICKPFPGHVPEGHHTVYVADNWEPCSAVTIAPYIHPVKVMEAFK